MKRLINLAKLLVLAADNNDTELTQFVSEEINSTFDPTRHGVNVTKAQIDDAVRQMYNLSNSRIYAIRLFRTLTGQGLIESKEYVEALVGWTQS